ncbi:MAG: hypothetical protein EZS28_019667 [Streblomastix strix]|uniref:Uncharacterized protein n=1 Tax=Streblomastix strix TaxID=222440 RepID=A0A5J4VR16_9EUKA|nr:MAG: hypothetical protein EZS28_019667 [Streblomastix strix]
MRYSYIQNIRRHENKTSIMVEFLDEQKKEKKYHISKLYSMNGAASYEETSKAIHFVKRACKIPTGYTVILIKFSSMTKSIDQGAIKIEISRATRHNEGSLAVANHYDKHLNDKIRTRLAKH